MKEIKHFNLKRLFSLVACIFLALCLAFTVACDGGSNSSGSSSSSSKDDDAEVSVTDYQSIKNGDFEFGTSAKNVTYPVYTGINWTKYRDNSYSTSAISSTKNSGIIDTEETAYAKIAETNNFPKNEDGTYFNPKTPESYGLGGNRYVYDKDTYEDNPNEDKLCTKGSKILMIHNVTSVAERGTAQKFVSSSSLTTKTGYGKISVWVLTKDLKSRQKDQHFGAYLSVNNTLSSSRAPFLVKNIDTKGVWANYVIYLKTSDYAKSSYTVTVGLGFGSDKYMAEYVEGFAYFDDIHYEEIDKETFDTETADKDKEYSLFNDDGTVKDKEELKADENGKTYVKNENKNATTVKYVYSHLMKSNDLSLTFTGDYNKVYQHNLEEYAKGAESDTKAFNQITGIDGVTNPYGETATTTYVKLSQTPSSFTLTSGVIEIPAKTRKQFNFLTNVHVELQNQPGAKIDVEEVKDAAASEVLGTASVASNYNTYSTDKHENVWKKVSVFVENDKGAARYIRLKLTLGSTDNVFGAANYALTKGYALFTGFNERTLPESEYDIVSSEADYKSTITLGYEYPNGTEETESETDNFAFTATTSTKTDLTYKPATGVQGYTGVIGNHTMVGGNQSAYTASNVISGVVSSKNAANYDDLSGEEKAAIDSLRNGENVQPLMIKNVTSNCYGYLGSQLTLSANTTTLVTVQVKVLDGATANVYIANADPLSKFPVLTVANKPLTVKVTKDNAPTSDDKWVTVNFVITTGDKDVTYRVELWNGSRDGQVQSQGTVLFNSVTTSSSSNVTALKARMQAEFGADVEETRYTRKPSTVKYTDENGKEKTYERTYLETVVCTEYKNGATIFASLETIDAPDEIDETTSKDDDSSSSSDSSQTTDNSQTANWALQLTSIIIAAVLVVVLAIIIIRLIVKKNKKAEVATGNFYNRSSREQAQAQINANKARRAKQAANAMTEESAKPEENQSEEAPAETTTEPSEAENNEAEEEEKPYDYDNPENNV